MTQVRRVSLPEMLAETGMPALGYSRPQDDEILLVEGLPKGVEREVLGHEAAHISKGQEGPFLGSVLKFAAPIVGGIIGSRGSKSAAKTSANAQREAAALASRDARLSLLTNILMNTPAINTGNAARSQLAGMLGVQSPAVDYAKYSKFFEGGQ